MEQKEKSQNIDNNFAVENNKDNKLNIIFTTVKSKNNFNNQINDSKICEYCLSKFYSKFNKIRHLNEHNLYL